MLVDGISNPLGHHGIQPRFSWQFSGQTHSLRQEAYRVGVASTQDAAASGEFDLWDSGKVSSPQSLDIAYGGPSLGSRQRAWWVVRAWMSGGEVIASPLAYWEMGLLQAADWHASWLAAEDDDARSERLAGFFWHRGPVGSDPGDRTFRVAFDLPAAAPVTLLLAANAKVSAELDGCPLELPVHSDAAFGSIRTARVSAKLDAGRHTIALAVSGTREPGVAIQIQARTVDGAGSHLGDLIVQTCAGVHLGPNRSVRGVLQWTATACVSERQAPLPSGSAFLLRRQFCVDGAVTRARLYVTALGVYEVHLNGRKIGKALLTPELTDYRKRLLYAVHDVADYLRQGENVLGAFVGEGWYGSNLAPTGRYSFGPPPLQFLAQLELSFADGRNVWISGDDLWRITRAPITRCGIYDGEDYDARLDQPGWSTRDFKVDAALWEQARVSAGPATTCRLIGAVAPAIERICELSPKAIFMGRDGRWTVDFGQNFAGWVRLKLTGRRGREVTLRFAERLDTTGKIDQSNLRGALATDRYVLAGDPDGECYEPRFTYHGFRYVEIAGLELALVSEDVSGIVIHSNLPQTGSLVLGADVPQRTWQNTFWSQRSNFIGIPTDCPQRDERLGWLGDARVFWDAAAYNMDVAAFTERFLGDVEDAQRADGSYVDFAPDPTAGSFTPAGSSPGWGDAGVILPWTIWWRYGDTGIIDQHWNSMVRFMASIRLGNPRLVWQRDRGNDFGDWLALDTQAAGDPTTPKALVGTAMWQAAATAMQQMANATGRNQEARYYENLANSIAAAFARAFVKRSGVVGNGSQTGYALALHFDLLPQELRRIAAGNLAADIARRGTVLSTGFIGTPFVFDALASAGENQLIYDLLLKSDFPSWGYMSASDATTIWERWDGDTKDETMNSLNHYALGAVTGFMFRRIAGIDALTPGFVHFLFDPIYDPRMRTGGGRYLARVGLISTRWEWLEHGHYQLQLEVPINCEALVVLPARDAAQLAPDSAHLAAYRVMPDASRFDAENRLILRLDSGRYDILVVNAERQCRPMNYLGYKQIPESILRRALTELYAWFKARQ